MTSLTYSMKAASALDLEEGLDTYNFFNGYRNIASLSITGQTCESLFSRIKALSLSFLGFGRVVYFDKVKEDSKSNEKRQICIWVDNNTYRGYTQAINDKFASFETTNNYFKKDWYAVVSPK